MRLIKILLMIVFFVCSIVFFVQNMATLSNPLALRFDPLPTFSKIENNVQDPPAEVAIDSVPGTASTIASVPTASFLAWKSDGVPLYIVILATFAIGVLVTCTFFLIDRIRHTYVIVGKKRRIRILEGEVKRLKSDLAKVQDKVDSPGDAAQGNAPAEA